MIAKQGNKHYVYRSVRQGDKIKRIYVGIVNSPEAKKLIKEIEEKENLQEDRDKVDMLENLTNETAHVIDTMISSLMLINDFYFRKSEWRKEKRS